MTVSTLRLLVVPLLALLPGLLGACREGDASNFAGSIPITPTVFGSHGCNAPNQAFVAPVSVYSDPAIGPMSQIAAPAGADILYLTGGDGSVHELDFSGGVPPVDTVLVASGVFDAALAAIGIAMPAQLSGVAVLDAANLLVVEHTSNTIWLVDRLLPDSIRIFAGFPTTTPGFADGLGAQVRFSFTQAVNLTPTLDGTVFIADVGNHALRRLTVGVLPLVETMVGSGAPFFNDAELPLAGLDTPVATNISCGGRVLIVEAGGAGVGSGFRLRSAGIGMSNFFTGFSGEVTTLAGNGLDVTTGGAGTAASLAAPRGLASSDDGEIYWVDSTTGILRRHFQTTAISDCPLFADCATAVAMGGSFTNGGGFSLAITQAAPPAPGKLYVLDADADMLFQVSP